jgi:5-methyltetrahydropteroyltriglutamate--homocysteine methyltransferase
MTIPTEPIGSIPRPDYMIGASEQFRSMQIDAAEYARVKQRALRDTIEHFEATGSPVITDGEQSKSSFVTYPLTGLPNLTSDGIVIPFEDGHTRQLPRLTAGPFRYGVYASQFVTDARRLATRPVKQAVISASALSLLYPQSGIPGYTQEQFLADLVAEAVKDIRYSLDSGADSVQIDFTEGRLSLKLDPSGGLLKQFVDLNNRVLDHFTEEERRHIGVHTCPGGDRDATHSAAVDYADLLPTLFQLRVHRFYVQLASEPEPARVLSILREHLGPDCLLFVGVIDPINARVESPEEVRDRILQAAAYIPVAQLGSTDDCGFSPFADDISTSRDVAFAKIRSRVTGTEMASRQIIG